MNTEGGHMRCTVCQKEMVVENFGGVKVDVCKNGCKGLWFDWTELNKLDEKNEGLGEALNEALKFPRNNDENRGQIKCPKCGLLMHAHKFQSEKEINVDECYKCGGFFLDSGELKIIRDKFMSEAERQAYEDKIINQDPVINKGMKDLEKEEAKTKAVQRYTRFLRLSYYCTGK
jgi:uncharacterized protein